MRRLRGGGVAAFSASRTVRQCDTARLIADDLAGAEHRLKGILDATILWREGGFPITDSDTARAVLASGPSRGEGEAVTQDEGGFPTPPPPWSESDPHPCPGRRLAPP